jgi:nickel-dependent lactate racemase
MITGMGSSTDVLTEDRVADICRYAFGQHSLDGKSVLVIIPDLTRTAPIDMMFRTVYGLLADRVAVLDFIVALGTHQPLSEERMNRLVGITSEERHNKYSKARFFNHEWDNPAQLVQIGTLHEDEVADISEGLMREEVDVHINKMVLEHDVAMIIGPTFPHEVVGFSGGNKYFFPGIAGQEILNMFHWLGAMITNPRIIGKKYTPVRKVVDKAASLLELEKICLSLVVKGTDLAGLYIGSPEEAWRSAADLSNQLHIVHKDKPFKSVLARCPVMYEDLWTGGKCMYKLEPVVADGGELIIYAPHIRDVSVTHGDTITEIGYHVRDYFIRQMDRFKHVPRGIMAHSTHVKGTGTFENGVEKPRVNVVLASRIPPDMCEKINLGYRDPASINPEEWQNREEEGLLYVKKAGEMLYRLHDDPFEK